MNEYWKKKGSVETAPFEGSRIYLASPWFNEDQMRRMKIVLELLKEWASKEEHRAIFSPYEEFVCPPDANREVREKTYVDNIKAIAESDILVGVTDEKDVGTIFEMGYAAALRDFRDQEYGDMDPIVVGVALDLPEGAPFNLMLSEGLDVVCTTLGQLRDYLFEGIISTNQNPIE